MLYLHIDAIEYTLTRSAVDFHRILLFFVGFAVATPSPHSIGRPKSSIMRARACVGGTKTDNFLYTRVNRNILGCLNYLFLSMYFVIIIYYVLVLRLVCTYTCILWSARRTQRSEHESYIIYVQTSWRLRINKMRFAYN